MIEKALGIPAFNDFPVSLHKPPSRRLLPEAPMLFFFFFFNDPATHRLQKDYSRTASPRSNAEAGPQGKIFGSLETAVHAGERDFLSQDLSVLQEAERNRD